jgi:hypothetical protein
LSDTSKFDTLSSDLENRLDELFREDAPPDLPTPPAVSAPPAVRAKPAVSAPPTAHATPAVSVPPAARATRAIPPDYPLAELKKTVLSIDWEITPETLDHFQDHIRLLKEAYQRDKIISMLLQILGSLGQYIKASRSNVHPSTFTVLNSVFARLEEIVTSPGMSTPARKKLLQTEMAGYQELRDKIQKRQASVQPSPAGKAAPPSPAPASPAEGSVSPETLTQAIEELKAFIRSELKTLKDELRISVKRP